MLRVRDLQVAYGAAMALRGVSIDLLPGQLLAVLGRNGSGRSTLAQALMGLVPARGQVRWHQHELLGRPAHQIARLGLGHVPESRDAFPGLSVHQNLMLGLQRGNSENLLEQAYAWFPALAPRRDTPAGVLSGGEQQLLSLARTLMGEPRLLIVDEPTEGLAPQWVDAVGQALSRLKAAGVAIVLIEQKFTLARLLADRVILLGRGAIVFEGSVAQLQADADLRQSWLDI